MRARPWLVWEVAPRVGRSPPLLLRLVLVGPRALLWGLGGSLLSSAVGVVVVFLLLVRWWFCRAILWCERVVGFNPVRAIVTEEGSSWRS